MRLVTFTSNGRTRAGALIDDATLVDLAATDPSLPADMLALLEGGRAALDDVSRAVDSARSRVARDRAAVIASGIAADLASVTLEAPVQPRTVLAIGLNYRDHAEETGQQLPKHPIVFSKVATCITGPGKPIHIPAASTMVDWEGELCAVIGRPARHVAAADAGQYVAGYTIGNDVSVRDWQSHSPTWMMGKGFDTHGPIGPWLVTPDEVDASNLGIRTYVNDVVKQDSNTKQLIFDVGQIIEYLTTAFTLRPGDVIFTGTPAGVGVARNPREFLKPGDTVRIEIDGLGALENPVKAERG